jgi:hypothetical protein
MLSKKMSNDLCFSLKHEDAFMFTFHERVMLCG